jgi:membrane protease YdiL (CAAX protease family)
MTLLPFGLLMAAVLGLWLHRAVWMGALAAAVVAGYFSGALHGLAALWVFIAAVLAWSHAHWRDRVSGLAFFGFALAMALALLPGFVRVELVPPRVLSEGAVPYGIGVGFPKVVVGVLVLGMIHPALLARTGLARVLASAAPVFLLTAGAAMLCVLALGYTAFAPKWTTLFLLWAPINLFFTCLSEEAFFRGFVQQELAGAEPARTRAIFALVAAAVLFGLAHFAGGVGYVLAATVAGLGYGWAFLRTGRIEAAIAVHFAVNAVHFLLFAYPRLKFLPGD